MFPQEISQTRNYIKDNNNIADNKTKKHLQAFYDDKYQEGLGYVDVNG